MIGADIHAQQFAGKIGEARTVVRLAVSDHLFSLPQASCMPGPTSHLPEDFLLQVEVGLASWPE